MQENRTERVGAGCPAMFVLGVETHTKSGTDVSMFVQPACEVNTLPSSVIISDSKLLGVTRLCPHR